MSRLSLGFVPVFLASTGCAAMAEPAPGVTVDGKTSGVSSEILSTDPDATLYAMGVYEGASKRGFRDHPEQPITITIAKADGPKLQLALGSYEPIEWQLAGPGAGRVSAVYLAGYYNSRVTGGDNPSVIDRSGTRKSESSSPGGGDWGGAGGGIRIVSPYGYDAEGIAFVQAASGSLRQRARSFTGSYSASGFTIGD